jgi:hypothetical protein
MHTFSRLYAPGPLGSSGSHVAVALATSFRNATSSSSDTFVACRYVKARLSPSFASRAPLCSMRWTTITSSRSRPFSRTFAPVYADRKYASFTSGMHCWICSQMW